MKFKSAISGKVLLPGTVSFSTSYQWWLIRQMLLISASSLPTSASSPPWLLFLTKQPYSKKGNSRIHWYRNAVFTSNFSSFRCLFVIRFGRDIVLSSLYYIKKAWIHHVMSLRRYFYPPKLWLVLSKAGVNSGDLLWVSSFKSWSCMKLNLQHKI